MSGGGVFGMVEAGGRFSATMQARIIFKERRAIGADRLSIIAHIDEDMRMIEGRGRADAHELLGSDADRGDALIVLEVRDLHVGHGGWLLSDTAISARLSRIAPALPVPAGGSGVRLQARPDACG